MASKHRPASRALLSVPKSSTYEKILRSISFGTGALVDGGRRVVAAADEAATARGEAAPSAGEANSVSCNCGTKVVAGGIVTAADGAMLVAEEPAVSGEAIFDARGGSRARRSK